MPEPMETDADFQAWVDTIRCRRHGTHWRQGCAHCDACIAALMPRASSTWEEPDA